MQRIRLTGSVQDDLAEIWHDIALEQQSPLNADSLADAFDERFQLLAQHPESRGVKILSRATNIAKTRLSSDGHGPISDELMCRRRRQCFRDRSQRNGDKPRSLTGSATQLYISAHTNDRLGFANHRDADEICSATVAVDADHACQLDQSTTTATYVLSRDHRYGAEGA